MPMPFEMDPVDLFHLRRKQLLKLRWCGLEPEADALHGRAQPELSGGSPATVALRRLSQERDVQFAHRISSSPR
jgi:hypothetical protein